MLKMIFLILSILFIVGCDKGNGLPEAPVKQFRGIDVEHNVCSLVSVKYDASTGKPKYTRVAELPLEQCDGTVGVSPTDFKKMEAWLINVNSEFTCKVRQ